MKIRFEYFLIVALIAIAVIAAKRAIGSAIAEPLSTSEQLVEYAKGGASEEAVRQAVLSACKQERNMFIGACADEQTRQVLAAAKKVELPPPPPLRD